jgi:hypothetical protein
MDDPMEPQHTETKLRVHPVLPNAGNADKEKPSANLRSQQRDLVHQPQPFVAPLPRLRFSEELFGT